MKDPRCLARLPDVPYIGLKPCAGYSKARKGKPPTGWEGRTKGQGKKPISNGCGPGGLLGKLIPQFPFNLVNFTSACDSHDICYGTCGASKEACDSKFLSDMRAACDRRFNRFERIILNDFYLGCKLLALTYYAAVDKGGDVPYEDAQDEHCKWECCTK